MKYIDEFRSRKAAESLAAQIRYDASKSITLMEVCGTHTMAIARNGIRDLLPSTVALISGPGCPVCVTPNTVIDRAIAMSRRDGVMITTFGDMLKVPGSTSSLDREHAHGRDIRIVSSTLEAIELAAGNPDRFIVFIGVGFETTAPTVAASILQARDRGIENYGVLCAHKTMPQAMRTLSQEVQVDGFLCPGHVCTVVGSRPFEFLAKEYGKSCVVSGFEPLDILQSIFMLVRGILSRKPEVQIQYTRAVKPEGNPLAWKTVETVFEPVDSEWRGIGEISGSGLRIRPEYSEWDAEKRIRVEVEPPREPEGCLCGLVLQGRVRPTECPLFGTECNPEDPVGPCMVSSEGTCAAYYKYHLGTGR